MTCTNNERIPTLPESCHSINSELTHQLPQKAIVLGLWDGNNMKCIHIDKIIEETPNNIELGVKLHKLIKKLID